MIIPSNIKGTGFLRNRYKMNKQFLGGLITEEEYNTIVDKCSRLTADVYSHNRKKDIEGVLMMINIALSFSIALLLCYAFLMYYGIRDDGGKQRIAAFFLLGISVFIASVIGIINFF